MAEIAATNGKALPVLWACVCVACLCAVACAASGSAPVLGARSTCIGIYHRYPEVPTTAEAALDDMRALEVRHVMFWLSTKDLYPAYAVDSPGLSGLPRSCGSGT